MEAGGPMRPGAVVAAAPAPSGKSALSIPRSMPETCSTRVSAPSSATRMPSRRLSRTHPGASTTSRSVAPAATAPRAGFTFMLMPLPTQSVRRGTARAHPRKVSAPPAMAYEAATTAIRRVVGDPSRGSSGWGMVLKRVPDRAAPRGCGYNGGTSHRFRRTPMAVKKARKRASAPARKKTTRKTPTKSLKARLKRVARAVLAGAAFGALAGAVRGMAQGAKPHPAPGPSAR